MGKQFTRWFELNGFSASLNEYIEKNNVKVLSITPVLDHNINCAIVTEGFYVLFEREQ
jgi:hypothetical protein